MFAVLFSKKRVILAIALGAASIYTAIVFAIAVFNLQELSKETRDSARAPFTIVYRKPPKIERYFNILNGERSINKDDAVVLTRAVVIDNDTNARPQSGLDRALIIIEFPVEGGVTRFVALFNPFTDIPIIGPIRSIRPYFLDFVQDTRVLVAHSGGSPQALTYARALRDTIADLDEIGSQGKYFWRDRVLPGPHNLFTSSALLTKAFDDGGVIAPQKPRYEDIAWKWQEERDGEDAQNQSAAKARDQGAKEEKNDLPHGRSILIDYSTNSYEAKFLYDDSIQRYVRYLAGKKHITRDGDALTADNVLISFMEVSVLDNEGRLAIGTIGNGNGFVCGRAVCREGVWKKPSARDRIRFFIGEKEAELYPGVTWLEIVPIGRTVAIE